MILSRMTERAGEWLRGSGPQGEVVISSRVRLARNLAGHAFVNRCDLAEQRAVMQRVQHEVQSGVVGDDIHWVELAQTDPLDRQLLVERHLISQQHAAGDNSRPRAVAIASDERFAIMVNEEDHLRIQVLRSGMQLEEAFEHINRLDDALEQKLAFAFSPRFGYLTACPTNVGTGIRVSVMLHLPGLALSGEMEKVKRAAGDLHIAVRGMFGEGSQALGDLFQISNQVTLGKTEREILADFQHTIVPQIVNYERQARLALVRHTPSTLDDHIWRAWGILAHARIITAEEVLGLLSHLRLGVNLGRLSQIDLRVINELFLLTQPAHLQRIMNREMDRTERRIARADLIRKRLTA